MAARSKKLKPITDEELDRELAQLWKEEVEAADKEPLTAADLEWFESLPEGPALPTKEGDTCVIFFKKALGISRSSGRRTQTTTPKSAGDGPVQPMSAERRRRSHLGKQKRR